MRRQLQGADLLLVTKTDLCDVDQVARTSAWLDDVAAGVPQIEVVDGAIEPTVVLGVRPPSIGARSRAPLGGVEHVHRYDSWSWSSDQAVELGWLHDAATSWPDAVIRAKGVVRLVDGTAVVIQRVGRRVESRPSPHVPDISQLVAIAVRTDPPTPQPSMFA